MAENNSPDRLNYVLQRKHDMHSVLAILHHDDEPPRWAGCFLCDSHVMSGNHHDANDYDAARIRFEFSHDHFTNQSESDVSALLSNWQWQALSAAILSICGMRAGSWTVHEYLNSTGHDTNSADRLQPVDEWMCAQRRRTLTREWVVSAQHGLSAYPRSMWWCCSRFYCAFDRCVVVAGVCGNALNWCSDNVREAPLHGKQTRTDQKCPFVCSPGLCAQSRVSRSTVHSKRYIYG